MIFTETKLKGAFIIDVEPREDERGFFARSWCMDEFEKRGLNPRLTQCNISFNKKRGTLRGMHYQAAPFAEAKLVRCTMGAIYDVIIDLRPSSETFKQWTSVELTAENRRALYIPEDFAHGFQTLVDDTEVFYQMSEFYHPECARGVRWNDPVFGVEWLITSPIISDRDTEYSNFIEKINKGEFEMVENKDEIKSYWEERAKNDANITATTDDVYLRELEIRSIAEELKGLSIKSGTTILDVGCGDGYSTINVSMNFPDNKFYGIDYSEHMIENAKKRLTANPSLSERVSFAVGDVTDLKPCLGDIRFPCVMTDRCLINMDSYEGQVLAISQIAEHVTSGGFYIAIENFIEGHDNMNAARIAMGLLEIKVRWHNLFFTEAGFEKAIAPHFELLALKDFTSAYYYATRVIYSKMCQMRGEQPDYLHDIHKLAIDLPQLGNFSPIRMAVLKRK
jgi:dTDP-4-dehydrorhamnose 3,5-epimerase